MEIINKSFTVVGARPSENGKVWTILGPERAIIKLDYHPAFETLYPKGSSFPCLTLLSKEEGVKYEPDWLTIYASLYVVGETYQFKVVSIELNAVTFAPILVLQDSYGFTFKIENPCKTDLDSLGKDILCRVTAVKSDGLTLESLTEDVASGPAHLSQGNLNSISTSLGTGASYNLFDKLHDSREASYREFSKRSFKGIWRSVIDKYPDTAHFIPELLQNADDANATEVTMLLGRDAMIFKHNGTVHFSVTDEDDINTPLGHINSITGIGESTKNGTEFSNKIGKFGVGFKSVFQYTDAPEIYDDYYWFRIRNIIVPERLEKDNANRLPGETLFFIPFKDPKTAYAEIRSSLKETANGLLFLHNLKQIHWKNLVSGETKTYSKTITETTISKRDITLERISLAGHDGERNLLMFSRNIIVASEGKHKIYVGYYLRKDGLINTHTRPNLYCFFPTSESFGLCMVMHAPFLLVDNRQQIKRRERVNIQLIKHLGNLAADTLCELRDLGLQSGTLLLDSNIADILKWEEEYNPYALYYAKKDEANVIPMAIIAPCVDKLKAEALLLSSDNRYLLSKQAYQISPASLAGLLTSEQLQSLRKSNDKIGILCPKLNEAVIKDIVEETHVNTYGTRDFASDITGAFMATQSSQWVNRLYKFLREDARKTWLPDEKDPFFLYVPIIENTSGAWVPPFLDGHINVFTEGDPAEYNVVSPPMLASHQAKKFLQEIGCKEPDQLDYINTHILERYSDSVPEDYDETVILSDFSVILKYYCTTSIESREQLLEKARRKFLVACIDEEGNKSLAKPSAIYSDTSDLRLFFRGTKDVSFFNQQFYRRIIREYGKTKVSDFLAALGILQSPVVDIDCSKSKWDLTQHQKEQLKLDTISATSSTIEDKSIHGLSNALKHPDVDLSFCIWRVISSMDTESYSKGCFKYFYYTRRALDFDSSAIEALRNKAWIFIDGKPKKPKQVSLEAFSQAGYAINGELCTILGIVRRELDLAQAGATKEQQRRYENGMLLEEYGITSPDEIAAMVADHVKRKAKERARESKVAKSDFLTPQREALQTLGAEAFGNGINRLQSPSQPQHKEGQNQERFEDQKARMMLEMQRAAELEDLRKGISQLPKYSKEWFDALLQLEYRNDDSKDTSSNTKAISISFGKVSRDPYNELILFLRSPSQAIPPQIETIDRIEVSFEFKQQEALSIAFDVASVRAFTLRLKAKAKDVKLIAETDWSQCTRASVSANNPTELMGKLITAFKNLAVDDGFNFKDNLKDNISFVFGPPGTGKTTFVAKRICDIVKESNYCKILVLTPTNKACDVITEKISTIADNPAWLGRFVATGSDYVEQAGLLINRDSELYEEDHCCIVSTIARLPYDGFVREVGAPRLRDLDWDYVVIDEASMIPLAQIVYAIYTFSPYSNIIIAGDPLQIPPIVSAKEWENENIYTMVNLQRFDNPKTEPISFDVTNLTTQYRAVPALGEVFSRFSYNGLLKHNRAQKDQLPIVIPGLPMESINIVEFKVEMYDNIFGPKKLDGSPVQIYSVLLVTEMCQYICNKYRGDKGINIGIICPYVAEAQMIDRLVDHIKDKPDNINFHVGTIHGFQGDECDIVFAVFNPPKGMKRNASDIMLNRDYIINVAISRARDFLFLLIPHPETDGAQNLLEINRLVKLASSSSEKHVKYYSSDEIERMLFGREFYLENNTFVTSHQMANVYSEPGMKYEVRIDDNAVDIQISE